MKNFFKEFSTFLKQGSMIEIATGLLIATAFNTLVTAFSDAFLMPIINRLLGFTGDINSYFEIAGMRFEYGMFVSALISFIIIAFVLFLVVKGYNKLTKKDVAAEEAISETELDVLKEIKALLEKQNKE